jgi:putative nucleotidyltransferase with HDIG domain
MLTLSPTRCTIPWVEAQAGVSALLVAAGEAGARGRLRAVAEDAFPGRRAREARDAAGLAELAAAASAGGQTRVVVLLDRLGGVDVRDAVGLVSAVCPGAAVVVCTGEEEPEVVHAALDAGALSCLSRGAPRHQAAAVLRAAADGHGLLDRAIARGLMNRYDDRLEDERRRDRRVIASLAAAVEAKDSVTSNHQRAVSRLAVSIAALVEPDLAASEDFLFGALLHDIGKIAVPEHILGKPGPLTDDEWEVMRLHPDTGAQVIEPLGLSSVVHDVVQHHHERWDGAGYPDGLTANAIPLAARIFSVADALEAMTANRPYRKALPVPVALSRIQVAAGRQFDPRVAGALQRGVEQSLIDLDRANDAGASFPPERPVVTGPRL